MNESHLNNALLADNTSFEVLKMSIQLGCRYVFVFVSLEFVLVLSCLLLNKKSLKCLKTLQSFWVILFKLWL